MVVVRIRKPAVTGPLQVVIRLEQNRYTVEQERYYEKTNSGNKHFNPKIKIKILICYPYSFTIEVVGRS